MYKLVEFIFSYLLILVDKFFVVDLTDEHYHSKRIEKEKFMVIRKGKKVPYQ